MKRITFIAIGLLASLAAVGSASAQDHVAKANIPFGFYAGSAWLPSGTYTLSSEATHGNIVAIRNADNRTTAMSLVQARGERSNANILVFKKYGNRYFLHEIQCSSSGMNVSFPASKREKQARTLEASLSGPSDVYLALLK